MSDHPRIHLQAPSGAFPWESSIMQAFASTVGVSGADARTQVRPMGHCKLRNFCCMSHKVGGTAEHSGICTDIASRRQVKHPCMIIIFSADTAIAIKFIRIFLIATLPNRCMYHAACRDPEDGRHINFNHSTLAAQGANPFQLPSDLGDRHCIVDYLPDQAHCMHPRLRVTSAREEARQCTLHSFTCTGLSTHGCICLLGACMLRLIAALRLCSGWMPKREVLQPGPPPD